LTPGTLVRIKRNANVGDPYYEVGVMIKMKKMFMVGQVAEVLCNGKIERVRRDLIESLKK